jgi:hypothetical protein
MEETRPQSVRCPECWQGVGDPCLTAWGKRAHYSHVARKREAATPAGTREGAGT